MTDNQYKILVEAKETRLAATLENQHLEHYSSLPIDDFDTARYGVQLKPFYKKITKVISVAGSKEARESESTPKCMKADEAGSSHWILPQSLNLL